MILGLHRNTHVSRILASSARQQTNPFGDPLRTGQVGEHLTAGSDPISIEIPVV